MSLDEKPSVPVDTESTPKDKHKSAADNGSLTPTVLESPPPRDAPRKDKGFRVKRRGKWLWIGLAGLLLLGGGGGYLLANRPKNQIDLEKLTVLVKSQNVRVRITASGTIVPVQSVNISPNTQGRIAKLFVKKGDRVQQGQAIALMENRDLQARVVQAQANFREALARSKEGRTSRPEEIAQQKARIAQAQAALDQSLEAGPTAEEINQAQARLVQARANLALARNGSRPEEINQAQAKVAQAQAALRQSRNSQAKQIEQTKAQLRSAQERTRLSKIRVSRYYSLWQAGATAKDKYDEALTTYNTNQADQQQIEQRLAELQEISPTEVAQRQAALDEAQQALQQLRKGTRTEEIDQKQAAVVEAEQALQKLENDRGPRPRSKSRTAEIAQRQAELSQAQAALKQLEAGQRPETIEQFNNAANAAYARLQEAQVNLQDSIVRAPFNGIITQEYATVGAFVTPTTSASTTASATSTAIFAIARDLEVKALVPEVDIATLSDGQSVEVVADAYPQEIFKGKVRLVSPEAVVEQNVTSFEVRVTLETGKEKVLSGMNANLTFLGEEIKNAVVVPTVAIVTQKGDTGVLIVGKDNEPEFRSIKIGSSQKNQTQVLEGLQSGERIFIEPPKDYKPPTSEPS
jgi:HlyD family secretion protein